MTHRFLAPVLSAQLISPPTGRPGEARNFPPDHPPRPRFDILNAGLSFRCDVTCLQYSRDWEIGFDFFGVFGGIGCFVLSALPQDTSQDGSSVPSKVVTRTRLSQNASTEATAAEPLDGQALYTHGYELSQQPYRAYVFPSVLLKKKRSLKNA